LIESATGVNGGYRLVKPKEEVSFLKVIEAVEGSGSLFSCGLEHNGPECLIRQTMEQSETVMEQYLGQKTLVELVQHLDKNRLAAMRNKTN
jgi:Rrf2 family protein